MTSAAASIVNLAASIAAAFAAIILAVFAVRQWHVMKDNNESAERQNGLVRDRWKRDDELRAEENRPKAAFGFSDCRKCNLKLSCANLGTVGFLVAGMQVIPLVGDPEEISFGKDAEIFIPVGAEKQVIFDDDKYREVHKRMKKIFNGSLLNKHLGIKLILQGPVETAETNLEAYRLRRFPEGGDPRYGVQSWRRIPPPTTCSVREPSKDSYQRSEFVTCPKCNNTYTFDLVEKLGVVFPVRDCGTAFEATRKKMLAVVRDLEQSCPTHGV